MDLLQSLEIKVGERDELVKGVGGDLSAMSRQSRKMDGENAHLDSVSSVRGSNSSE